MLRSSLLRNSMMKSSIMRPSMRESVVKKPEWKILFILVFLWLQFFKFILTFAKAIKKFVSCYWIIEKWYSRNLFVVKSKESMLNASMTLKNICWNAFICILLLTLFNVLILIMKAIRIATYVVIMWTVIQRFVSSY